MHLPILPSRAVQGDGIPLLLAQQLQHTLDSRARVIQKEVVQEGKGGMEGGEEEEEGQVGCDVGIG